MSIDLDFIATTTAHGDSLDNSDVSSSDISPKDSSISQTTRHPDIPGQTQRTEKVTHTQAEGEELKALDSINSVQLESEPKIGSFIKSSRIQPLNSPPQLVKLESESIVENDTFNQRLYPTVHKSESQAETGLRSPIEQDHIRPQRFPLKHTPIGLEQLPSFTQSANTPRTELELPPLGRPAFLNPATGLITRPKPVMLPRTKSVFFSQSEPKSIPSMGFSFMSHVQNTSEPLSHTTEPSHGIESPTQIDLQSALHGDPQPVVHSGYEPPTEPGPHSHTTDSESSSQKSSQHDIDDEIDSISGLFSTGSLSMFGSTTAASSKNPFDLPASEEQRTKSKSDKTKSPLDSVGMLFNIQGDKALPESVKKSGKVPASVSVEGSVEKPVKKLTKKPVEKPVEKLIDNSDAFATASSVEAHVNLPTEALVDLVTKAPADVTVEVPGEVPNEVPAAAPVEVPIAPPVEAPIAAPVEVPVEVPIAALVEVPVVAPIEVSIATSVEVPIPAPIEVPVRKKDPRGRKPKALTNPQGVTNPVKAPSKKKPKATNMGESSTSAPIIKKSKRQADRQALLKAAEEEEERRAADISIRLVDERIATDAENARQLELVQKNQARDNVEAEYIPRTEPTLQQLKSSQQGESSQHTSFDANTKPSEIIDITDTESEFTTKKSGKKKLVKTKKNSNKSHAITESSFTELDSIEDSMLDPIESSSRSKKHGSGKGVAGSHSQKDINDEYVPKNDGQPALKTLTSGRKRRAATTTVSYKDFELEELEEDVPRTKREKKLTPKAREALENASKHVKAVVGRPKRTSVKTKEADINSPVDPIYIDTDDEVKETEIAQITRPIHDQASSDNEEDELTTMLQSRDSKLVQADFRVSLDYRHKKSPSSIIKPPFFFFFVAIGSRVVRIIF